MPWQFYVAAAILPLILFLAVKMLCTPLPDSDIVQKNRKWSEEYRAEQAAKKSVR